jgi:hypothetical protein
MRAGRQVVSLACRMGDEHVIQQDDVTAKGDTGNMKMGEVRSAAKARQTRLKTIRKLLADPLCAYYHTYK